MDLKEIQNLIKFVANSGVAEVKLETGDVKITIRTTLEGHSSDVAYVQQIPTQNVLQQAAPQQIAPAPVATPAAPAARESWRPSPRCQSAPAPAPAAAAWWSRCPARRRG